MSSLPEEPTLLQSALSVSQYAEDGARAWAFLVFCGLVETTSHDAFLAATKAHATDVVALSDALLDAATRRAELVDANQNLARRLWQYFLVGQTLEAEAPEEGTDPGQPSSTIDS